MFSRSACAVYFAPEYGLELTRPRNEPWTMRLLVRRLPGLMDIRGCGDIALFRSGARLVDLHRLVDFRPFSKPAHLAVYRNGHDCAPLQNFELRVLDRPRAP